MSKTSSALATAFPQSPAPAPLKQFTNGRRWTAAHRRLALSRPQPRILLADADLLSRRRTSRALRSRGYDVLEQCSGPKLLHFLGTQLLRTSGRPSFDAMILDARMPGADGLTVLVTTQRVGWTLPIILASTPGDAPVHTRALGLGAFAVLNKPLNAEEVIENLELAEFA